MKKKKTEKEQEKEESEEAEEESEESNLEEEAEVGAFQDTGEIEQFSELDVQRGIGFSAPILNSNESDFSDEPAEKLEQTAETAPAIKQNENDTGYATRTGDEKYTSFSQYENDMKKYESEGREGIRPVGMLDEERSSRDVFANQFNQFHSQQRNSGTGRTQEIAEQSAIESFQREQEKYKERIQEETAPSFRRKPRTSRIRWWDNLIKRPVFNILIKRGNIII